MQPLFARLTKVVVVIVTAFCGNVNATAPDRMLDETVQLNPSESPVAMKSERRSTETARRVVAAGGASGVVSGLVVVMSSAAPSGVGRGRGTRGPGV